MIGPIFAGVKTWFQGLLTTHAGLTTGTHGVGVSTIASTQNITDHAGLTTGVHGVGGSTVESAAGAQAKANAAQAAAIAASEPVGTVAAHNAAGPAAVHAAGIVGNAATASMAADSALLGGQLPAAFAAAAHAHWVQLPGPAAYINLNTAVLGSPLHPSVSAWWGANLSYRVMLTDPAPTSIYGFSVQMALMTNITTQVTTISVYVNGVEQVATRLTFAQADGSNAFKSWVAGAGAQIDVPAGHIVDVRATATNRDAVDRYWYMPVVRLKIGAQP